MKLKHLAYHGGRKGTGFPGDNGLSNPIQQENVRLAITKALRLNYSISRSKNQPLFKKEQISLAEGTWILGLKFQNPESLLLPPLCMKYFFLTHHSFGMTSMISLSLCKKLSYTFPQVTFGMEKHVAPFRVCPPPPHIWYLMQTF